MSIVPLLSRDSRVFENTVYSNLPRPFSNPLKVFQNLEYISSGGLESQKISTLRSEVPYQVERIFEHNMIPAEISALTLSFLDSNLPDLQIRIHHEIHASDKSQLKLYLDNFTLCWSRIGTCLLAAEMICILVLAYLIILHHNFMETILLVRTLTGLTFRITSAFFCVLAITHALLGFYFAYLARRFYLSIWCQLGFSAWDLFCAFTKTLDWIPETTGKLFLFTTKCQKSAALLFFALFVFLLNCVSVPTHLVFIPVWIYSLFWSILAIPSGERIFIRHLDGTNRTWGGNLLTCVLALAHGARVLVTLCALFALEFCLEGGCIHLEYVSLVISILCGLWFVTEIYAIQHGVYRYFGLLRAQTDAAERVRACFAALVVVIISFIWSSALWSFIRGYSNVFIVDICTAVTIIAHLIYNSMVSFVE